MWWMPAQPGLGRPPVPPCPPPCAHAEALPLPVQRRELGGVGGTAGTPSRPTPALAEDALGNTQEATPAAEGRGGVLLGTCSTAALSPPFHPHDLSLKTPSVNQGPTHARKAAPRLSL